MKRISMFTVCAKIFLYENVKFNEEEEESLEMNLKDNIDFLEKKY